MLDSASQDGTGCHVRSTNNRRRIAMSSLPCQTASSPMVSTKLSKLSAVALIFALAAVPVFAQSVPSKQRTDGDPPVVREPGGQAFKQRTDGEGLPMVGPGSKAFGQQIQPGGRETVVGNRSIDGGAFRSAAAATAKMGSEKKK